MKITRDGKEIELTEDEVHKAFIEQEREYLISDITAYFERNHHIEISPEDAEVFIPAIEEANDALAESNSNWRDETFHYVLTDEYLGWEPTVNQLLEKYGVLDSEVER